MSGRNGDLDKHIQAFLVDIAGEQNPHAFVLEHHHQRIVVDIGSVRSLGILMAGVHDGDNRALACPLEPDVYV